MKIRLAILFLLLSIHSWAAISFDVAANGAVGGTGTAVNTGTFTSLAGDEIWVLCGENTDNTQTATVSDSGGNTYTQIGGYVGIGVSRRVGLFHSTNSLAISAGSVTCTWTASVAGRKMSVLAFSGVATTSSLDSNASNPATSSASGAVTSLGSGSLSTSNANDVIIYGVYANSATTSLTAGTGFTMPAAGTTTGIGLEYEIVTSTQTNLTNSVSWTTASTAMGLIGAAKQGSGAVSNNVVIVD